jgi:hypothetical protein
MRGTYRTPGIALDDVSGRGCTVESFEQVFE